MATDPDLPSDPEEEGEQPVAKEMFDATYRRVDVVKGPAHGMRFVVLKAGQEQDPDAIAAVQKADLSTKSINDLPDSDFAYIEPGGEKDEEGKTTPRSKRHFPIHDEAHVRNALSRAPQSPFGDKAMPAIRSAAKKFGIEVQKSQEASMSKKNTAVEATNPDQLVVEEAQPVIKADGEENLDASEVLADGDGSPAGLEQEPGSPAWEAVDAATARKWTGLLARAKNALETLATREGMEVAAGDGEDAEQAFDLEDAACAIDYAIGVLAKFAVDEQVESDRADEEYGNVAKALTGAEGLEEALNTIEGFAPVRKAGRVLSAANESLIRTASENLQKVLASLPQAPEAVTKAQEAEETMTEQTPAAEAVSKAKGDPMVPVYDADGKLCGMVESKDIVPIADAPGAGGDGEATEAPAEAAAEAAQAGPEAQPTPAAASAAPETAPHEDGQQMVAKSEEAQPETNIEELVESRVQKALEAADEEHRRVIKSLEERIATLENQPMPGGPLLRGANLAGFVETSGGKLALRGQTTPENPEIERVRKQMQEATDPVAIAALSRELSQLEMRARLGGV